MIGTLFKDLPPISNEETEISASEDLSFPSDAEDLLLASLPVVQKIVRRKSLLCWQSEASDLVQKIALRLLKWRDRHRENSDEMSPDEWQSFAAQTAYNEINRHFSNNPVSFEVPLAAASDVAAQNFVEGQSEAEFYSLARLVWQEICNLSLRQRLALLLNGQELVNYLLVAGITDEKLADVLELTMEEWVNVKEKLPLSDLGIAGLFQAKGNRKSIEKAAKSIKKARHEARAKLRRLT